jgi:N-methylhydantoinase A
MIASMATRRPARYRVGVDVGGTFTDIVLLGADGSIHTKKVSSTTDDYGRAIVAGLAELFDELEIAPDAVAAVVHGTTVATNAILEGRGARTALLTTAGFRDVLEFRRIRVPVLYNLLYEKPPPLVPRRLRFEVAERIGPRGEIRRPLDPDTVASAIERIRAANVQAVAITLLHSYANPAHELAVKQMVRERLPDLYVTSSVDILPEIREYERTSTTVINAYIGPIVRHYLRSLLARLRGIGVTAPLLIMQSNGGVMTAESAIEKPAHIVESGPAAGVIASARTARLAGYPNAITLDMGGTTAKASMIQAGQISQTSEYEVGGGINLSSQLVRGGGYALKLPLIDISEIGAGGGSIVAIDKAGAPQIGPRSAGAVPGPICYDLGGDEPTITDANVILGYINPQSLAGGRVRLNAEKAGRLFDEKIARRIGLPLLEAAHGVYTIVSATMMRAVKAVSTYRGRDPREFLLLAFGGSGPICAAELARALEMERVLIPPAPGLFSAFGLLCSHNEHQLTRTYFRRSDAVDLAELNGAFAQIEAQALAALRQEGHRPDQVTLRRYADLRYAGQAYELTVPVAGGELTAADLAGLREAFGQEHLRTYGHRASDEAVDLVSLRVTAQAPSSGAADYDPIAASQTRPGTRPDGTARPAYFGPRHGLIQTPILARTDLTGAPRPGPLIVEEYDATCVVPPGCRAALDRWGNVVIEVGP